MATWLTFASVDQQETASILRRILDSGYNVVRTDQPNESRFWFKDFGQLGTSLDESPVVVFYPPRKLADSLWTIGRLLFPQSNLQKKYPQLGMIKKSIAGDLQNGTMLWDWKQPQEGDFKYYLEGSIQNRNYILYGMPSSLPYLKAGGYFVEGEETESILIKLGQVLALRGVII